MTTGTSAVLDGANSGVSATLSHGGLGLTQATVAFVLTPTGGGSPVVQIRTTDLHGIASLGTVELPLSGPYSVEAYFGPGAPDVVLPSDPVYQASSSNSGTLTVTPPTVVAISRAGSNPTNAATVSWTVTFNTSVTGVSAANFTLASTGLSGAGGIAVSGSGSSYTVSASAGTGSGTLALDLSAPSGIADSLTDPLAGTFNGDPFTIDTTPPSATITFPANGAAYKASTYTSGCPSVGLCGSASDPSGVQAVHVSISNNTGKYWNGSSFTATSETFLQATLATPGQTTSSWSYPLTLPADGSYTIHLQATDSLGNSQTATSYAASSTFTIDTTPPSATITFPANGAAYKASTYTSGCPSVGLCGSASDPSGVQAVHVSISNNTGKYWNGSSFTASSETFLQATLATPGQTTSSWSYPLTLPADGSYTIHLQATDSLGNSQTATSYAASSTFTIDTTPPSATITFPANGAAYKASTYTSGCPSVGLCGSASDPSGVQAVHVSISNNTGKYWSGSGFTASSETFLQATLATPGQTTSSWSYPLTLPADGSYTIHLQATDSLGNSQTATSYAASSTFTIDTWHRPSRSSATRGATGCSTR